jgi:hypothetical protein
MEIYTIAYDGILLWAGPACNAAHALNIHARDIGYGTFRDLALLAEPPYDADTTTEAAHLAEVRKRYAVEMSSQPSGVEQ